MAPGKEEWTFVNHNGRLPIPLAEMLKEKEGKKVNFKLYVTPNFRIDPVQRPYGGANLINGVTRPESWPNIWFSKDGMPQCAELSWEQEEEIKKVEIIFDTQLDMQMYTGFPRWYKITGPAIIAETVRDFDLEYLDGSEWKTAVQCRGNIHRRWITELNMPIKTKSLKVVIKETWGVPCAGVYEIKVF
jgi:hypothetical protein